MRYSLGYLASVIRYLDARVLCNGDLDESQVKSERHECDIYAGTDGLSGYPLDAFAP